MFGKSYKRYLLAVLTFVYALNYLDRNLIILLLEPIKQDLNLSDTQLGFLTGIAFGLFYATVGIPIARWADRGNRATIAATALGLWSMTAISCLFVSNFVQLVCVRVAAAVGESGCMPPTYSLVGDYFSGTSERTRAMSIYTLAGPLASLVSFIAGGWLYERYGWRGAFAFMGLPAVFVAIIVKLTVVEPRARRPPSAPLPASRTERVSDVFTALSRQPSLRNLAIAYILLLTMALGLAPWYAAFMTRSHGMHTSDLGIWLGLMFGFGGITGTLLGGYVSVRWFADNEAGQMRLCAVTIAALVPSFVMFLLLPGRYQALLLLFPLNVVFCFFLGPTFALMQRLVPDHMRATAVSLVLLLSNLIGMGIGPQIVGILSDTLHPYLGTDSLRYAMLAMSSVALWSAYHFWKVGQTVVRDLSRVGQRAVVCAAHPGAGSNGAQLGGEKGRP